MTGLPSTSRRNTASTACPSEQHRRQHLDRNNLLRASRQRSHRKGARRPAARNGNRRGRLRRLRQRDDLRPVDGTGRTRLHAEPGSRRIFSVPPEHPLSGSAGARTPRTREISSAGATGSGSGAPGIREQRKGPRSSLRAPLRRVARRGRAPHARQRGDLRLPGRYERPRR